MTENSGPREPLASEPLLAVLDTQVWIDIYLRLAILDPTQPYTAIFDAFIDGEFIPVYSRPTFDELKYMLTSSRDVAQRFRIDVANATEFVESIFYGAGEFAEISGEIQVSSDKRDDMFVETAMVAHAYALVAEDGDLHEDPVRCLLRENGIRLLYPKQFRKLLEDKRACGSSDNCNRYSPGGTVKSASGLKKASAAITMSSKKGRKRREAQAALFKNPYRRDQDAGVAYHQVRFRATLEICFRRRNRPAYSWIDSDIAIIASLRLPENKLPALATR